MSPLRSTAVALALAVTPAAVALAQSPTIEHSAVKCIVAGKYRRMPARFTPEDVAQPRVYFRPEGVPSWYYVEMKPEAQLGHVGTLPKATKQLVGKHIDYYVEAASKSFDSGRTPEYNPIVVAKDSDCGQDLVPALYTKEPPTAVFPSVPQGFAIGGGVAGGTVAAIVGGTAAAGGGVIALTRNDDEAPSATPPPPTPTPTPIVTPTPTPTPTPPVLDVACQADPRQGAAPLLVKFNSQATLGPNANYAWDFGDGGTSNQINPSHTYASPGSYLARVVVTSGTASTTCSRTITVFARSFRLQLSPAGTGSGRITGDGIDCPGDCSEEYAPGTTVALTAIPTAPSTFGGWGGDCSGNTTCSVTMNQDRNVTATFIAPVTFPLTVTVGGSGTGSVSSGDGLINCPGDCNENYVSGSSVTLTANPTGGSTFTWGGDCTGTTGPSCTVNMTAARNVSVTFTPPLTFRLTLTVIGANFPVRAEIQYQGTTIPPCQESDPPGTTCINNFLPGTVVTLIAQNGPTSVFQSWGGDCGLALGGPPTCTLLMDQNHTASATFSTLTIAPPGASAAIVSRFDVAGVRAQALLNGTLLEEPRPGTSRVSVATRAGENRLEAQLLDASRGGTWTFDLSAVPGLERGTLRVTSGEAVAVGPDSIVFRLTGRAGERLGFAFQQR